MQQTAYVIVEGKKILVLQRLRNNNSESLKIRKSGKDGMFLLSHSQYLEENRGALDRLLSGKVIIL